MASRSIKITGLEELVGALAYDREKTIQAMNKALYAAATHVGLGADELVPEDTGNLRSSQQITYSKHGTKDMTVEIAYGGPVEDRAPKEGQEGGTVDTSNYAILQHERDYNHPKGGQKKYLEQPFLEEVSAWPSRLMDRIRTEFHSL